MERDTVGLKHALEALASTEPPRNISRVNGVRLKAIIGKTKNGQISRLDNSKGMTDDDIDEIKGILQGYSVGWMTFKSAYRTNSKDISTTSGPEKGRRLYIETDAGEEGANFYDPQGFYKELSEWGYSLVDSRIEIRD